jgi:hypothetical protein
LKFLAQQGKSFASAGMLAARTPSMVAQPLQMQSGGTGQDVEHNDLVRLAGIMDGQTPQLADNPRNIA